MKRTSLLKTCLFLMLCEVPAICHAQNTYTVNAEVGQVVTIPCGVQVNGNWTRLVWKLQDVSNSHDLAYIYDGSESCDKTKKDCSLTQDGSLVIIVTETDSGDYFCVLDEEEKYYSRHTLIIDPKVLPPAFYTCPTLEDVFVTQTGPQEMVLAYTSPVCGNTDVVGNVTCDPPSGVKIGMNFEEIVCNCTHSGNQVDTCEIPIPDAPHAFENCPPSDPVNDSKTVGVGCAPVTVSGILVGIVICIVLGVLVLLLVCVFWYKKCNCIPSNDEENIPEKNIPEHQELMIRTEENNRVPSGSGEENEEHTKPQFTTRLHPQMPAIQGKPLELTCSASGYPTPTILWYKDGKHLDYQAGYNTTLSDGVAKLTSSSIKGSDEGMYSCIVVNPAGDDITSCNVVVKETIILPPSDGNGTLEEVHSDKTESGQPFTNPNESGNAEKDLPDGDTKPDVGVSCSEIRGLVVNDVSTKFTILPSKTNPTEGIAACCMFGENLTVGFLEGDSDIPDPTIERKTNRMAISVANEVAVPLHIKCLQCGKYCCSLEICGGEWSKEQEQACCKDSCAKDSSDQQICQDTTPYFKVDYSEYD